MYAYQKLAKKNKNHEILQLGRSNHKVLIASFMFIYLKVESIHN